MDTRVAIKDVISAKQGGTSCDWLGVLSSMQHGKCPSDRNSSALLPWCSQVMEESRWEMDSSMNPHSLAPTERYTPFSGRNDERIVNLVDEFRVHSTSLFGSPLLAWEHACLCRGRSGCSESPFVWEHDRPGVKEAKPAPPLVCESPYVGPVSEAGALHCG